MERHLYIGGLICLDVKGVDNSNTAWSVFIKRYFPFIDNDLLDIGRNIESTTGHEKLFYTDQKTTQNCRLSEEIDEDFESECQALLDIELQQQQQVKREYDFIMMEEVQPAASKTSEDLDTSLNSSLNVSLNQSINDGVKIGIQTDPAVTDSPKLRVNKRNATEVKSACAPISSVCDVSVETFGKALQIVCKDLYNHDVYLSPKEQAENEGVNLKS